MLDCVSIQGLRLAFKVVLDFRYSVIGLSLGCVDVLDLASGQVDCYPCSRQVRSSSNLSPDKVTSIARLRFDKNIRSRAIGLRAHHVDNPFAVRLSLMMQ